MPPCYAIYTLATVGDELLRTTIRRGYPPTVIISDAPGYWEPLGIPILMKGDPGLQQKLKDLGIEFAFVAGWTTRIDVEEVAWMPKGVWNMHPSLLPKYRGFNPYFWVLAKGEVATGITVHQLAHRFDTGAILLQAEVPILPSDTTNSLFTRVVDKQAAVGAKAIMEVHRNRITLVPQAEGRFPRAPKVRFEHTQLLPELTVEQARNLIQACNPDHGATSTFRGMRYRVYEASLEGVGPPIPCADGVLRATVLDHDHTGIVSGETLLRMLL